MAAIKSERAVAEIRGSLFQLPNAFYAGVELRSRCAAPSGQQFALRANPICAGSTAGEQVIPVTHRRFRLAGFEFLMETPQF
ncbi:MAG: hypothetical protein A4S14_19730 [Proteobacteria bacterium SG_bin9]|nr:MAG: hypothetical protein A4S14_19730 [Proteobacteria bacterium SG_bin9]